MVAEGNSLSAAINLGKDAQNFLPDTIGMLWMLLIGLFLLLNLEQVRVEAIGDVHLDHPFLWMLDYSTTWRSNGWSEISSLRIFFDHSLAEKSEWSR
ncbi:hypothetical protein [Limosilactobacillus kribbianus]|uniref:hypothetical protein n=1 Tax=Limosilactobacillus kribbianus TaxID=2982695 RepID=UPI0022648B4B|nr:hypothetical protein [Limosilactobacillus kribbianus]